MQTTTQPKTDTGRTDTKFHDLTPPRKYTVSGLREMNHPDEACPDGQERFYAAAQIDGVESYGPTAEESRDAYSVLYINIECTKAVSYDYITAITPHHRLDRVKDLDPEHPAIDEMSGSTAAKYAPMVEKHDVVDEEVSA